MCERQRLLISLSQEIRYSDKDCRHRTWPVAKCYTWGKVESCDFYKDVAVVRLDVRGSEGNHAATWSHQCGVHGRHLLLLLGLPDHQVDQQGIHHQPAHVNHRRCWRCPTTRIRRHHPGLSEEEYCEPSSPWWCGRAFRNDPQAKIRSHRRYFSFSPNKGQDPLKDPIKGSSER